MYVCVYKVFLHKHISTADRTAATVQPDVFQSQSPPVQVVLMELN